MTSLDPQHAEYQNQADEFAASSRIHEYAMFSGLMPAGASLAEMWGDEPLAGESSDLLPRTANWKRTRDFLRGRRCAKRAMEQIEVSAPSIRIGEMGAPVWPQSLVGSITHTNLYAASAVAPLSRLRSIGIDAEEVDAVLEYLWGSLFTPPEQQWLHSLPQSEQRASSALLFSAKEAIYKAQFPLTRAWLEFHHVEVVVHPERRFVAVAAEDCPPLARGILGNLVGRFAFARGHVMTAVWLPVRS